MILSKQKGAMDTSGRECKYVSQGDLFVLSRAPIPV